VTPFLRHFVYNASTGAMVARTDTLLDGSTIFNGGAGTVGICTDPLPCDVSPICFQPNGRVEFISNRGTLTVPGSTTNAIDADWKWQTNPDAPAASWWDMYRIAKNGAWTDDPSSPATGYEATAHWVGAHCNGLVQTRCNPVGANEGPGFLTVQPNLSPANPFNWYASATFDLPADADPASIQIEVPALAADQILVEWRLNNGPWQPVGTGFATLYTLPPSTVPGAQAGTNRITLHIHETSPSDGSEGLLAHVVATYEVTSLVQWTRILCPDGTVTYLDDLGEEQTTVPAGWVQVPCPGGTGTSGVDVETWPLCVVDDATGDVLQHVRAEQVYDATGVAVGAPRIVDAVTGNTVTLPAGSSLAACPGGTTASGKQIIERCGCSDEDGDGIGEMRYVELWSVDPDGEDTPQLIGTYIDGDFEQPFTPAAPMDCPGDGSGPGVNVTLTGARSVTGTAPQDLAAEFTGLQSVTLIVHSGTALATLSSGSDVPFPAGVSGTWSTGGDGLMDAASFEGADAGTSYLLLWTYTA
jgi:hypothetical protein